MPERFRGFSCVGVRRAFSVRLGYQALVGKVRLAQESEGSENRVADQIAPLYLFGVKESGLLLV